MNPDFEVVAERGVRAVEQHLVAITLDRFRDLQQGRHYFFLSGERTLCAFRAAWSFCFNCCLRTLILRNFMGHPFPCRGMRKPNHFLSARGTAGNDDQGPIPGDFVSERKEMRTQSSRIG